MSYTVGYVVVLIDFYIKSGMIWSAKKELNKNTYEKAKNNSIYIYIAGGYIFKKSYVILFIGKNPEMNEKNKI